MLIKQIILGSIASNCYIVSKNNQCFIIDPGFESPLVIDYLKENNLTPEFIYVTHGHFDHIGGVNQLSSLYKIKVYAPKLDMIWFEQNDYNYTGKKVDVDVWVNDNDTIKFLDYQFKVILTPGHSAGSTALYHHPHLFSGDTLFKQGIGRTDLPFGSFQQLQLSIKQLYQLPDDTIVYPGHGPTTTIEFEKKYNPYIRP